MSEKCDICEALETSLYSVMCCPECRDKVKQMLEECDELREVSRQG